MLKASLDPDSPLDLLCREIFQQFDEQDAIVQADTQVSHLWTSVRALRAAKTIVEPVSECHLLEGERKGEIKCECIFSPNPILHSDPLKYGI